VDAARPGRGGKTTLFAGVRQSKGNATESEHLMSQWPSGRISKPPMENPGEIAGQVLTEKQRRLRAT